MALLPLRAQGTASRRATVTAARATSNVRIDGRIDVDEWAASRPIGEFRQIEPREGAPAAFATAVRVQFDDHQLYIAAFCRDSLGAAGVRVQDLRRKWDFFANDFFGVTIDALHDGRNSVSFQVTPLGSLRELQTFDGSQFNREWEGVWRARTQVTDSGYTVEIAIPWATLRYRADGEPWGINFYRMSRRANEYSAWSPWPRAFTNARMAFAGQLTGLEPPPPQANIRVRPYVTAQSDRRGAGQSVFERVRPRIGGEATWTPTPSSTLDVTANTDFAQADVDRQVVNLSRFSVFFPERRQFFLDAANVLAIGFSNDYKYGAKFNLEPFFSRRIGLDNSGNPVPLDGGVRYVRRDAQSSLGLLAVRQRSDSAHRGATFGTARLSRNFGTSSRLGGLVATRMTDGGAGTGAVRTTVGALDGFTRIAERVSANGLLAVSRNDSGVRGAAASILLQRQTDRWLAVLHQGFASAHYAPATGFVSRTNVLYTNPVVQGTFRPTWRPKAVRQIAPYLSVATVHSAGTGVVHEVQVETFVDIIFQNGALLYPDLRFDIQRLDAPFEPVHGVTVPAGVYQTPRYLMYGTTDPSKRLSGTAEVSTGGYFDRSLDAGLFKLRFAPSPRVAIGAQYEVNHIHGRGAGVTTHLVAPELRLALNPRVQFTTFYQHNTDAQRGSLNARFSWELSPLSYLFVVVNDGRAFGSAPAAARAASPSQQVILKFTALRQF